MSDPSMDNLPFWPSNAPSNGLLNFNDNPLLDRIDLIKRDIYAVIKRDAQQKETISRLEQDLSVYKRAVTSLEADKESLRKDKEEAEKQRNALVGQLKGLGHRVIALIDGDGAIFAGDLIKQGQQGGHAAARKLSDSIIQHLTSNFGSNAYQLWVYVFVNKRGLTDAFGRSGLSLLKSKFDDFILGFNQAAERFLVVDVGPGKEAADAKIKAYLEDEIRLPHTFKVIFGGCHDNGYVTNLRSQITSGFREKLILLQSYTEMAAGIADLELPTMVCPDLFMSQKIGIGPKPCAVATPLPPVAATVKNLRYDEPSNRTPSPEPDTESFSPQVSAPTLPDHVSALRPFAPPPTYSSALQTTRRASIPDVDSLDSCSSSETSEISCPSSLVVGTRHINPKMPLSKQKPPPCTLFYLSDCKFGAECKYGHEYLLNDEHIDEIRQNAKKAPCPTANKGEVCLWADRCCYGHVCSLGPKCHFYKQGRCKFMGADMHKDA